MKKVLIAVLMMAAVSAMAQDEEPYTKPQVWGQTNSYSATPDNLMLKPGHVVLAYPDAKVWVYTVIAVSNGVPIELVVDGKKVSEKEITATMTEVEVAIGQVTAPTIQRKVMKALLKIAAQKLL